MNNPKSNIKTTNTKNTLKKAFLFTLALLPVAIVAGICTTIYQINSLSQEILNDAISQLGSVEILIAVTTVQTVMYASVCGFFGYILTSQIGLIKPFILKKKSVLASLLIGGITGVILVADHFIIGIYYPEIQTYNASSVSLNGVFASVLYGGIIEEVMLRFFFMSLISFIIWKLFFRKYDNNSIPQKVFIIANVIAALIFAAGHIPATVGIFGSLNAFLVLRCFVLNGLAGYLFGELFRKHGIGYAMIAHATAHITKFVIFAILI